MTARVITLKGPDAGRYYLEVPGRYYLDGDEPPGTWLGRGAEALGLDGEIVDDDFLALMDGRDPTGQLLGTAHTDRTVRGFDVTFSAPKSVSVLWALGDERTRREVLAAHDAAVEAVFGWIEAHAHCRYRVNGEIWTVDADGLMAVAFRQHTSRAHDPQLHTHLVIANRVMAPDGRWLALDARTLKHDQRTISALYGAALRAELTGRLGVRWREVVHGQAEIADAPEHLLDGFSQRTRQYEVRCDGKVERFVEQLGRLPTPRERWALEREAVVDSRPAKTSETAADLHQRWAAQATRLGITPEDYLTAVLGKSRLLALDDKLEHESTLRAVSSLRDTQSVWRPAEVTREIAAALPTRHAATAAEVVARADRLASQAEDTHFLDISRPVPDGVALRSDGRPVTESAVDRMLTAQPILDEEEHVLTIAQRWADGGGRDATDIVIDDDLTPAQRHAAAAVAGERRLVLVVGPAGTGKTTAMRPAVAHLRTAGRPCFGVAPSAAAAEVLADDTGLATDTLDKLLVEHRLDRPPRPPYDLTPGTTVIVDEAAMVATPRLAELFDLADRRGWRLVLLGDPMQFSAVGRSGLFGHLVDTHVAIDLDRVHRFHASWERDASLRLRRGDTDVVPLYDAHDRIHGGTARQMAAATVAAWRQAIQAGQSAAMMAPTRDAAAVLNQIAQATRMAAGELDHLGPSVRIGAHRGHVGDVVATRRNERTLRTDRNRMVKNRDQWMIESVRPDGGLVVTGATGRAVLPADYVAAHVELAYAETSHATQGRTVDRSFLYLDGPTDSRGVYVPLTRGRATNEAFVALHDDRSAAEVLSEAIARTRVDQPATALRLDRPPATQRPLPVPIRPAAARLERPLDVRELRALATQIADHQIAEQRLQWRLRDHDRALADLAQRGRELGESLDHARRDLDAATRSLDDHDRPFHRRSHRAKIDHARHERRNLPGRIAELEAALEALPGEIDREQTARTRTARSLSPTSSATADQARGRLDRDAQTRGRRAATKPSGELVDRLGPVPNNPAGHDRWITTAGRIEQHRALAEPRPGVLLGPIPPPGRADEAVTYYAAQAALTHLDKTLGRRLDAAHRGGPEIDR